MKIIGIIEDHPMVAHGVKNMVHLIWDQSTVHVFDTFPKEEQEIIMLANCSIIIADIHLKEVNILDDLHLQQIQKPSLKIILYTSSHPWELGLSKHEFPFWGYVQKNADLQSITECLSAIEQNKKYIQDNLDWEKRNHEEPSTIVLTKREQEILQHIKAGKTSKEIGEILFLSELTVKSHRQNMMRKFDVKNVVELLAKVK
jgi:DNA-binding NarL/FixJ family response regulator